MKVSQDRKKCYADNGRTHRELRVGKLVFLKVQAKKSSLKFGRFQKLAERYFGTFVILENIGHVAYMIAFPMFICIHNVFHASFLKKHMFHPNHVVDCTVI